MKILFVIRKLDVGGAERQLLHLASGLRRKGHHVRVLVFYPGGALEDAARAAGVQVNCLEKAGRWDILGPIAGFLRTVRESRPDIVHSYMPAQNLLAVCARSAFPNAKVVWGVRAGDVSQGRYGLVAGLISMLHRRLAARADLVISNSHAALGQFSSGFVARRCIVIPNGIDTARFAIRPDLRAQGRRELGVLEGEPLIGIVGRLDPMKDHPTFLRAAAQLRSRIPTAKFVIVGEGDPRYVKALRDLAGELRLDRITWLGRRSDVETIYNSLDVLASTSAFGEGFSNVMAEAMACGAGIVATDVGDARVVVGEKGIIVGCSDPSGLADGILRALGRPRTEAAGASARISSTFGIERLVNATEAALQRLHMATEDTDPRARTA